MRIMDEAADVSTVEAYEVPVSMSVFYRVSNPQGDEVLIARLTESGYLRTVPEGAYFHIDSVGGMEVVE